GSLSPESMSIHRAQNVSKHKGRYIVEGEAKELMEEAVGEALKRGARGVEFLLPGAVGEAPRGAAGGKREDGDGEAGGGEMARDGVYTGLSAGLDGGDRIVVEDDDAAAGLEGVEVGDGAGDGLPGEVGNGVGAAL